MSFDSTERLVREALADQAARAVDPQLVRDEVHRRGQRGTGRRRVPVLVAAATIVAAAVAVVGVAVVPRVLPDNAAVAGSSAPADQNILLVGLDETDLADSITLVHLSADGSASGVSLPRDSWVNVPGHGMGKLNSAYATARQDALAQGRDDAAASQAGASKLTETVRELTGVAVDHYALVDMAGFARLSTAVGGVSVCLVVDRRSDAVDASDGMDLSGQRALDFLRQRQGLPGGDLDRIARHQAFLAALVHKLVTGTALTDEASRNTLLGIARESARVDPGWDLVGFVEQLRGVRLDSLRLATIPTGSQALRVPGGGVATEVVPEQVRSFVAQAFTAGSGQTSGGATPDTATSSPAGVPCVS